MCELKSDLNTNSPLDCSLQMTATWCHPALILTWYNANGACTVVQSLLKDMTFHDFSMYALLLNGVFLYNIIDISLPVLPIKYFRAKLKWKIVYLL